MTNCRIHGFLQIDGEYLLFLQDPGKGKEISGLSKDSLALVHPGCQNYVYSKGGQICPTVKNYMILLASFLHVFI